MDKKIYQKIKKREKRLTILVIIHGFPPYYMAGSEVYTWNKCRELSKKHNVVVFTRIENDYQQPYEINESIENGFRIIRVNKPSRDYTFRSKYLDKRMAELFKDTLKKIRPDIVHIDHLSHLTVHIVNIIKEFEVPIVFTLHDFWMICIRGQLIHDDSTLCDGPSIEKCQKCNMKYFTSKLQAKQEIKRWLTVLSEVNKKVDLFIAPSKFLYKIYIRNGISRKKIIYMDYGFDKKLFDKLNKISSDRIRFGFLGRLIPVKGIALLIDAFNKVDHSKSELNIFGALPNSIDHLINRCANSAVHFKGSYHYSDISNVLSNIDVLVVPSIWFENSPLVIHEAFLVGIPVIASDLGGMAELISPEKNGVLFKPGSIDDLKKKMDLFIDDPNLISKYSQPTYVRSIEEDVVEIEKLYYRLLNLKEDKLIAK